MELPRAEADYLRAVVAALRAVFGADLVGVYPTGSVALDGYRPGRSDLDLIAVADAPSADRLHATAGAVAHGALPCPATGLELVLYDRAALPGAGTTAGYALNLNTGRELPSRAETGPGGGPTFWYAIDRDIAHQQRRVLTGPPLHDLTDRLPHAVLLPVVVESVEAHRGSLTEHGDNAVLNACRAWHFHAEGTWVAKPAAAAWARRAAPAFERLIGTALDSHRRDRAAGQHVATGDAGAFLGYVLTRLGC